MAQRVGHADHLVNFELLTLAKQHTEKLAFVPGGDMGAPPGGDPSQGGMAPPGGDPSQGGGMPPPPPGGGGGGPDPMSAILQKLTSLEQNMAGAGGAGGAGGAIKPKVDVNMVMLQILKILARIADSLGVQIPASEMVPGQADIQQLAQATQTGQPLPGSDPTAQAGGQAPAGAIPPVPPMQPSGVPGQGVEKGGSYREQGHAFDTAKLAELGAVGNRAAAIAMKLRAQRAAS